MWPLKVQCFPALHFIMLMITEYSVSLHCSKVVITKKRTHIWKQNCHFHCQFENRVSFPTKILIMEGGLGRYNTTWDPNQLLWLVWYCAVSVSTVTTAKLVYQCQCTDHNRTSPSMSVYYVQTSASSYETHLYLVRTTNMLTNNYIPFSSYINECIVTLKNQLIQRTLKTT